MYRRKKSFALLLAIILIATVCMPIHAENIYPLNDTISADNTELSSSNFAYHRDYTTGEVTMVDLTKIPRYNYQNTHECLSDEKLALTRAADEAYYNRLATASANSGTTRSSLSVIDPTSDILYKGVVLITVWGYDADGNESCLEYGTGFLVDTNVVVTASHVASVTSDPDDTISEVRVYPGIHYIAPSSISQALDSLDGYSYVTVSSATYGFPDTGSDWYVGLLSSELNNNIYLFNCTTTDESCEGEEVYAVGYGSGYKFRKVQSTGTITDINGFYDYTIRCNYTSQSGMSGCPVIMGRSCISIHCESLWGLPLSQQITDDILDIIFDYMVYY